MPVPTGSEPLWTVEQACAVFARAGVPVEPWRLRLAIRAVGLQPAGQLPSGPKGGRGQATYRSSDLQRIHGWMAPWLAVAGPAGGIDPDPDAGEGPA